MAKRAALDSKTVVAYLRVSTGKQALGLDAQRTAIEAWAVARGFQIVSWCVDDGVTGSAPLEARPGLMRAISSLSELNAGVLAVARRDRLARDAIIAGLIDRVVEGHGSQVFSADGAGNGKSPTDIFTRTIFDASSQLERALIAARTKAALAEKKARGERLGRTPMSELLSTETLQLVKSLHESGLYTQAELAEELNRRNVPTATGRGKWWKRTVQAALALNDAA